MKNYAKMAAPLFALLKTKEKSEWKWLPKNQEAFIKLKEALISSPVLVEPDWSREFIVQTDFSGDAIGAVLVQLDEEGFEHPVAFTSRILRGNERKWPPRDGEALAIVHALTEWRQYIHGPRFKVQTDHESLEYLFEAKTISEKVHTHILLWK